MNDFTSFFNGEYFHTKHCLFRRIKEFSQEKDVVVCAMEDLQVFLKAITQFFHIGLLILLQSKNWFH